MQNDNSHGSCASVARGFAALGAVLAMGVGLLASPAEAAPFAYVANYIANTVSVIDTATNTVVAPPSRWGIPLWGSPSPRMGSTPMSRTSIILRQHCFGDRHGHQHGGGHGRGGELPHWGRRHPGRETRLCHECEPPTPFR